VAGVTRLVTLKDINVRENPSCVRTFLAEIAQLFVLSSQTSLDTIRTSIPRIRTKFLSQFCESKGNKNPANLAQLVARGSLNFLTINVR
jgi:hypothetical protein